MDAYYSSAQQHVCVFGKGRGNDERAGGFGDAGHRRVGGGGGVKLNIYSHLDQRQRQRLVQSESHDLALGVEAIHVEEEHDATMLLLLEVSTALSFATTVVRDSVGGGRDRAHFIINAALPRPRSRWAHRQSDMMMRAK